MTFDYGLTREDGVDTVHEFQSRGSDPWSWDPNKTICGEYITSSTSFIRDSQEMCKVCFPWDETTYNEPSYDASLNG